jgi:hypothetical protein
MTELTNVYEILKNDRDTVNGLLRETIQNKYSSQFHRIQK